MKETPGAGIVKEICRAKAISPVRTTLANTLICISTRCVVQYCPQKSRILYMCVRDLRNRWPLFHSRGWYSCATNCHEHCICTWTLPSTVPWSLVLRRSGGEKASNGIESCYFPPGEWVMGDEVSLCAVMPDGTLLYPRNGDVTRIEPYVLSCQYRSEHNKEMLGHFLPVFSYYVLHGWPRPGLLTCIL